MRLWIAGSRKERDIARHYPALKKAIVGLDKKHDLVILVGATGIDESARVLAHHYEIVHVVIPARWNEHGKAAGPLRNQYIIDHWNPQMLAAFPGPDSKGTHDAIRRAMAANINVLVEKPYE